MKIGFFTNTYLPNLYGLTVSIEKFRQGLEKLGHEVFVFAPRYYGYHDQNENVFRYPALFWHYKITYSIPISFYPPMNKLIDSLGLDIIHVHQPFSVAKDGLRQARRLKIPVVFTNHTRYEDYTHYIPILPQEMMKRHVLVTATKFSNQCDLVISPSQEIKELLVNRGVKTKVEVLPTGVNLAEYQSANREGTRKKLGIKPEEICLLWVGRMEKEKNVDFLLDAGLKILRKTTRTKFVLVGDGSEKKQLMERTQASGLSDRIIFTGLINHQELPDYYKIGDIFLQPSLTETQGVSTTEALCAGVAVVAIRATGTVDQVEDGVNGVLVEDDFKKFVLAVLDLINNPQKVELLKENAKKMSQRFDFLEQAKKLEKFYKKLLNAKKS